MLEIPRVTVNQIVAPLEYSSNEKSEHSQTLLDLKMYHGSNARDNNDGVKPVGTDLMSENSSNKQQ